MAFARTARSAPTPPPKVVSTLQVPDALLEWGRNPARVVTWPCDWAREVSDLAAASVDAPLDERATQRFLARLEGLVVEAIRADRPDLLTGLDMQTAEWLGLTYDVTMGDRKVSLGLGGVFDWSEVRVLTEAFRYALDAKQLWPDGDHPEPSTLGEVALRAMDFLRTEFPSAKLGEVGPAKSFACVACGTEGGSARIRADLGAEYCPECWFKKTAVRVQSADPPKSKRGR